MIAKMSLEPSEIEEENWYWHGIDEGASLGAQYIYPQYNFEKRKEKQKAVTAKQQPIRIHDERDINNSKLSLIPLMVDHLHLMVIRRIIGSRIKINRSLN